MNRGSLTPGIGSPFFLLLRNEAPKAPTELVFGLLGRHALLPVTCIFPVPLESEFSLRRWYTVIAHGL